MEVESGDPRIDIFSLRGLEFEVSRSGRFSLSGDFSSLEEFLTLWGGFPTLMGVEVGSLSLKYSDRLGDGGTFLLREGSGKNCYTP